MGLNTHVLGAHSMVASLDYDPGDRSKEGKIGIKKSLRREIPTPQEWARMKALLKKMEAGEIQAEVSTCAGILTACSDLRALSEGKRLHELISRKSLFLDERADDSVLENNIIQMYLRCGSVDLALDVFNGMKDQNVVAWTSLISAFTFAGHCEEAVLLFRRMLLSGIFPDRITFVTIVNTVGSLRSLRTARFVQRCIVEAGFGSHAVVGTAVIGMYRKCKCLELAREAFEFIQVHDRISWTAMITAYAESSSSQATALFRKMMLEGVALCGITIASALNACSNLRDGRTMHAIATERGFESEMVVTTALVSMYSKCGSIDSAETVFDRMIDRDVVLWTAMIGGYAEAGRQRHALELFREMERSSVRPNRVTYLTLVNACSDKAALPEARSLHLRIESEGIADSVTGSGIISMYGRCGSVLEARLTFEKLKNKCSVVWNSIIAVHTQNGDVKDSLELLSRMIQLGEKPDRVTFVSILSMCSHAGMVKLGCEIFVSIREDHRLEAGVEHYSCVADMLGRAGWLEEAEQFVRRMDVEADDGIWACLLGASRLYGDAKQSERAAKKVLELQPHNSEAYVVLANSLKDFKAF